MRTKETTVAVFPDQLAEPMPDPTSAHIGTIVSLAADGTLEVDLGGDTPVVPARLALRATRERIETAIAQRQQTVVLFENGDRSRPLIVGFIETLEPQPPAAHPDVVVRHRNTHSEARAAGDEGLARAVLPDTSEGMPVLEADVDGRRVRVTARDEIVLQCGSASVTLRRNGRVVIRGTYVETQSDGTNRIKGGQVRIN
jgi:hypothetical protein